MSVVLEAHGRSRCTDPTASITPVAVVGQCTLLENLRPRMRTGDVVNLTVVADGHVVHDGLEPLLTFVPARAGTDNERYRNGTAKVQYYSEQCRATEAARDRNGTGTVQERYRNGTVLQRAAQCCKDSTGQGRNRNMGRQVFLGENCILRRKRKTPK